MPKRLVKHISACMCEGVVLKEKGEKTQPDFGCSTNMTWSRWIKKGEKEEAY
jgi:hypothetical protein